MLEYNEGTKSEARIESNLESITSSEWNKWGCWFESFLNLWFVESWAIFYRNVSVNLAELKPRLKLLNQKRTSSFLTSYLVLI